MVARVQELSQLAVAAHKQGNRREFKLLSWISHKLGSTGVEPTRAQALAAFGWKS